MTDTTPTTATTPERATTITPELVKSKLQIALTKAEQSIQGLNNAEAELVYNEDNLGDIAKFIDNCKAAEKVVEAERVKLKEPYLQAGRAVDDGAKLLSSELATVRQKAHTQYSKLCMEVERKRQEAAREAQRVKGIRNLMDNFKMEYSTKVANATTSQELLEIERRVNLETGNKNRYAEFITEFVEGCKAIRSLISAQKATVRDLEDLERRAALAAENGSDAEILEAMEQKEVLEAKIGETKVLIQETAVNQSTNSTPAEPEIILPEIKGTRTYWKWELVDEKAATKAGLTMVIPNKEVIEEILKQKRKDGIEIQENGIRYFQETKF